MLTTTAKGAIAETKIAAAATELGISVLRPIVDHSRYDLGFELATASCACSASGERSIARPG